MEQERPAPRSCPRESRAVEQLGKILLGGRQRGPTDGRKAERDKLVKPRFQARGRSVLPPTWRCPARRRHAGRGEPRRAPRGVRATGTERRPSNAASKVPGRNARLAASIAATGTAFGARASIPGAMSMPKSEACGAARAMSGSSANAGAKVEHAPGVRERQRIQQPHGVRAQHWCPQSQIRFRPTREACGRRTTLICTARHDRSHRTT
jgi:hypothetical protein